jgi:hypothetical protein
MAISTWLFTRLRHTIGIASSDDTTAVAERSRTSLRKLPFLCGFISQPRIVRMSQGLPERRSSERFPTGLEGWFLSETTGDPTVCTVWDLSKTGVRLVIPAPADVPLKFELKIPNEGAIAMVRLIWADGVHFGAQFTD